MKCCDVNIFYCNFNGKKAGINSCLFVCCVVKPAQAFAVVFPFAFDMRLGSVFTGAAGVALPCSALARSVFRRSTRSRILVFCSAASSSFFLTVSAAKPEAEPSNRAHRPDFSQAISVDLIDAYIAKSINSIKNYQNFNNN